MSVWGVIVLNRRFLFEEIIFIFVCWFYVRVREEKSFKIRFRRLDYFFFGSTIIFIYRWCCFYWCWGINVWSFKNWIGGVYERIVDIYWRFFIKWSLNIGIWIGYFKFYIKFYIRIFKFIIRVDIFSFILI